MARITYTLRLDNDLFRDAVESLGVVHHALARRHGLQFRALDRRIEALIEGGLSKDDIELESIHGTFVSVPAGELRAILMDARRLGLIN